MASGFSYSGVLSNFGSAVTDLLSSQGSAAEADAFRQGETLATENSFIARSSGAIQGLQAARLITQTLGAQQADIGKAGFAESGSALDVLADSQRQASLTKGLIAAQTGINVNAYEQQASAFEGEAAAADAASEGGLLGGLFQGASGLVGLAALLA